MKASYTPMYNSTYCFTAAFHWTNYLRTINSYLKALDRGLNMAIIESVFNKM